MKIKKIVVLGALAAVAGASVATGLTSCGEKADPTGLDIHLNYSGKQGISLRDETFNNKVENANYVKGDLLPTWKAYAEKMGVTIRDAATYGQGSDNDTYSAIQTANYMSETSAVQFIDLFYNNTGNIEKAGGLGQVVDLKPYIAAGKMPNFKKFLDANPTIEKTITKSGKIYYTPYFDGYQAIERMFVWDTNMVKKILDVANDGDQDKDTATTQGTDNENNVGIGKPKDGEFFEPFVGTATYNYEADKEVPVSVAGAKKNLTVKKTTNIIAEQNKLLANGTSGAVLRKQLRDYLKVAYANGLSGDGKIYENLSDIFVSESAAYNTDDMIALMRCIKASSELITGSAEQEIQILIPRGQANNRVANISDFIKVFGIQGMDGESEMLYYGPDAKMHDGASTAKTYEAVDFLGQLYAEGLILTDFNSKDKANATLYLNQYFGHTTDAKGYGFMLYDYSASTCAMNSVVDGVGTADSKRKGDFKDTKVDGMMPVLSPLTWWQTKAGGNPSADSFADSRQYSTLIRYEESNRALKSNSWCIPTTADNKDKAVELMDYLMGEEGKRLNDFGPSQYWKDGKADSFKYAGETTPQFNDTFKSMISSSSTDFWSFLRGYLGSTHGIGYVRSATINYLATNKYAQVGTANIETSIADEASVLCKVDKYSSGVTFDTCVPTAGYNSIGTTDQDKYAAITAFWAEDKCSDDELGWVKVVKHAYTDGITNSTVLGKSGSAKDKDYTLADIQAQMNDRIKIYLGTKAKAFNAVPSYAA